MSKPLRRYAFTIHAEKIRDVITPLKKQLRQFCTKWVFQLEKGTLTGREHIQGRLVLMAPRRLQGMQAVITGAHFSPEHDSEASDFYSTKDDTRLEGPWSDQDRDMPWDLAQITNWRPWQQAIFDSFHIKDDRLINVLVDTHGGIGKSKVFKWAVYNGWAGLIPVIGDAKDMIQAVCSMGERPAYIIDLPRSKDHQHNASSMWKAIEQVKNGIVIDLRYTFKQLIMGSPVIWVFTNQEPDMRALSMDRWKVWAVENDTLKQTFPVPTSFKPDYQVDWGEAKVNGASL